MLKILLFDTFLAFCKKVKALGSEFTRRAMDFQTFQKVKSMKKYSDFLINTYVVTFCFRDFEIESPLAGRRPIDMCQT